MKKIKFKHIMIAIIIFSLCCGIFSARTKGYMNPISVTCMMIDGFLVGILMNEKG